MTTNFNWAWISSLIDTKRESNAVPQGGGTVYSFRQAISGQLSGAELNSFAQSVAQNLISIRSDWRNYIRPILNSLPAGSVDTRWSRALGYGLPDKIDCFKYGIQGSTLFVFNDANNINADGRYWSIDDSRPKTIAEVLEDLYTEISDIESAVLDDTSVDLDPLWAAIGETYNGTDKAASAGSLDTRTTTLESHIQQLNTDIYEPSNYSFSLGDPLTYSIAYNLEKLLQIHGVASWQSNPSGVNHDDVIPGAHTHTFDEIAPPPAIDQVQAGGPYSTLENEIKKIRYEIQHTRGSTAWYNNVNSPFASDESLYDHINYVGSGTASSSNPHGLDYNDVGCETVFAVIRTFTGMSSNADYTPTYSSNSYVDNGDSLQDAIGKLDAAIEGSGDSLWSIGSGTESLRWDGNTLGTATGDYSINSGWFGEVEADYSAIFGLSNIIVEGSDYSAIFGGGDLSSGLYNLLGNTTPSPYSYIFGSQNEVDADPVGQVGYNFIVGSGNDIDTDIVFCFGTLNEVTDSTNGYGVNFVIGGSNTVDGRANFVAGLTNTLTDADGNFVVGYSHNITADGCGAIGNANTITENFGLAIGYDITLNCTYSFAHGESHQILDSCDYSSSFGYENIIGDTRSAPYSMTAGNSNTIDGTYSTERGLDYVFGESNTIVGDLCFVAGELNEVTGNLNQAFGTTLSISGNYNTLFGNTNESLVDYTSIPNGKYAIARWNGSVIHSGYKVTGSNYGDFQSVISLPISGETKSAVAAWSQIGFAAASDELTMRTDSSYFCTLDIVARKRTSNGGNTPATKAWQVTWLAQRGATNISLVGYTVTSLYETANDDEASWDVRVAVDTDHMEIEVYGSADNSYSVYWQGSLRCQEVCTNYPEA